MDILILGVNGFIGSHLTAEILEKTDWTVHGMDLASDRIAKWEGHKRFRFLEGDIDINHEWIAYHVRKCDVCLPLVAIATPASYVSHPLEVFELDFEHNLRVVRQCAKYHTRVVFPSTSEVYGMCPDEEFDEESSPLVYGPVTKPYPGAFTFAGERKLLVWSARHEARSARADLAPGTIAREPDGIHVTCGDRRRLRLARVELDGREGDALDFPELRAGSRLARAPGGGV